jgi:signal transduction histidine kinase
MEQVSLIPLMLLALLGGGIVVLGLGLRHSAGRLNAALARAETAERSAAARGRCLSLVARELQGPGLAVLGHARRLTSGAGTQQDSEAVEAYARHLLRVADDIADFAAGESGPRHVKELPTRLGPLIDETVAAVAATLGPAQRHFRVAPDLAALTLMADGRALRGALREVLARAARTTSDGDAIDLRLVMGAESLAIVIEDEGVGMPAGDLEATISANGGEATRGLALGLALARDLMRAHGGELLVESASGIGARSWLTLPRFRLLDTGPEAPAVAQAA